MPISRGQKVGETLGGGLGGAAAGAALGSAIFPGIGTLLGGLAGGLLGGGGTYAAGQPTVNRAYKDTVRQAQAAGTPAAQIPTFDQYQARQAGGADGNWWSGRPAGMDTFNQYTPEQQAGMLQALQYGIGSLGKNQFDFEPIAQQARSNFQEQTLPGIAERFSSMGAQRSSAFGQTLGAAGAGLERDLAAMRQQYNLAQQPYLQDLLRIGLQPQFESIYRPAQQGWGEKLGNQAMESLLNPNTISSGISALRDWRNSRNTAAAPTAAPK